MEQKHIQSDPKDTVVQKNPGPWPWYALLLIGFALTGFFPWLIVSWAVYQRGRRRAAILASVINLAPFIFLGWVLLKIELAWWWLASFT